MKQISDLKNLQDLAIRIGGVYIDIDIALMTLQICNNFGLDMTTQIISDIRLEGVKSINELRQIFEDAKKQKPIDLIKKDNNYVCAICGTEINNEKYCYNCGYKINREVNFDDK